MLNENIIFNLGCVIIKTGCWHLEDVWLSSKSIKWLFKAIVYMPAKYYNLTCFLPCYHSLYIHYYRDCSMIIIFRKLDFADSIEFMIDKAYRAEMMILIATCAPLNRNYFANDR